jgi:hypothetical protein
MMPEIAAMLGDDVEFAGDTLDRDRVSTTVLSTPCKSHR